MFRELRKIRLLDTFNQLFINNLIITFYEQKSTYALCRLFAGRAGFLLAGGMFSTVDAKLATAKPTIGAKVLMGTQLSGSQMAGLVTGLEGLNPSLVDVTTFGAEWTLVQAKNADGTDKTNEFYLQNADGKYLADGGSGKNDDYRAILVDKSEDAAVFTLESNKYIKIVAGNGNDSGSWTSGVSAFY